MVLYEEHIIRILEEGKIETRHRSLMRILTREGIPAGRSAVRFDSKTTIREMRAWHIRADDSVTEMPRFKAREEPVSGEFYTDSRLLVLQFPDVEPGSLIALEWTRKEPQFVNQIVHHFQSGYPILLSRLKLLLPSGWLLRHNMVNYAPLDPISEDEGLAWVLHNLPPIPDEPLMPEVETLTPILLISYSPPKPKHRELSINTWKDVSSWASRIMKPRNNNVEKVAEKAIELARSSEGDVHKIRTISEWIQKQIRYVSIQIEPIGGYQPNPAPLVFERKYGDCKDKCTLMVEMLRAIGIHAEFVLVHSGRSDAVRSEFPSPLQFNHSIVACVVPLDTSGAVTIPGLGPVIFFDPSDGFTPLGELPSYLQGNRALIISDTTSDLVRLPENRAEANQANRDVAMNVSTNGEVFARVREVYTGQAAALRRRSLTEEGATYYSRRITDAASLLVSAPQITSMRIDGLQEISRPLIVEYTLSGTQFGTRSGNLFLLRPLALFNREIPVFSRGDRMNPVTLGLSSVREDKISLTLPQGFAIDEIPRDIDLRLAFGEFRLFYSKSSNRVILHRKLVISNPDIPASEYPRVKVMFDAVSTSSQIPLILDKQ